MTRGIASYQPAAGRPPAGLPGRLPRLLPDGLADGQALIAEVGRAGLAGPRARSAWPGIPPGTGRRPPAWPGKR